MKKTLDAKQLDQIEGEIFELVQCGEAEFDARMNIIIQKLQASYTEYRLKKHEPTICGKAGNC